MKRPQAYCAAHCRTRRPFVSDPHARPVLHIIATGGLYAQHCKIEGSIFNGREPDDERSDAITEDESTNFFIAETNLTFDQQDAYFRRLEVGGERA